MKKCFLAWLLRQLQPDLELLIQIEAARLVEQLELRLAQQAAARQAEAAQQFHQQPQPQRRFIGQSAQ
jgi:hypothetical protein